jgi:fructuronate reductase
VLSGAFPAGRPRWEDAGATFTNDITPFEHRKLWLLNGGHSLLAYAGAIRGHDTVADAVADDIVRGWLVQWWIEASRHLSQREDELAVYRTALLDRFANPRIRYLLAQIATDGSQKLPVRILPTLRRERAEGRIPAGATLVLGAWVAHLRGAGRPVVDVRADEIVPLAAGPLPDAVRRVVTYLDPVLGADADVISAVLDAAEQLGQPSRT